MRSLFWKEWRDLRSTAPLTALFTLLIVLLFELFDYASKHVAWTSWHADAGLSGTLVAVVCAGLIGARLFSAEVGSGTLQFLSSLPVSRRRLWTIKALSGLLAGVACFIASVIGWTAAMLILAALGRLSTEQALSIPLSSGFDPAIAFIPAFAAGLFTSPLFDRVTGASVACVFVCLAMGLMVTSISPWIGHEQGGQILDAGGIQTVLVVICILGLLRASYRAFTRGESLRTGKRIGEALFGLLDVALVTVIVPTLAFLWLIW